VTRPSVWAPLGLLYLLVAAAIVHFEGDAYRRSLREHRLLLAAARANKTSEVPVSTTSIDSPATAEPRPSEEPRPPETPSKATQTAHKSESRAPIGRPKAPEGLPVDPNEKFVKLPAIIIPNLPGLSAAAEVKIGADLNKIILAYHGDDQRDSRLLAVREAAQPIIDMRVRKEVPITITVIDSSAVTAFSHLGGYIYLSKGLLNLAATEEEYQFVVGHEVAHIDLRHSLKAVDEVMRQGVAPDTGTLQYFYHQITVGYGEARELEADDWIVQRMYKLNQSERGCRAFLERLTRYAKENDFENGNVPPKTDIASPIQDVDNALKALPAASLRKRHIDDRLKILSAAAAVPAPKPK
jgi:hypothetical protein